MRTCIAMFVTNEVEVYTNSPSRESNPILLDGIRNVTQSERQHFPIAAVYKLKTIFFLRFSEIFIFCISFLLHLSFWFIVFRHFFDFFF